MKKLLLLFLCTAFLAGCGKTEQAPADSQQPEVTAPSADATIPMNREMFTQRDSLTEYAPQVATLTFDETAVTGDTDAVRISDGAVIISTDGTYILEGSYRGTILVEADKNAKPQLVLRNFSATGTQSAPLYISQADKVFVTLEGENALTAPETFIATDDNNVDAAVFSKADLTFNGQGSLTVTCPSAHGIVAKDDLAVCGGSYTIYCASHGIQANDSVRISQGSFSITAGKDGIHAENEEDDTLGFVYIESGDFQITAQGDGISAGAWMQILDGTYEIVTGGGSENGTKASSDNYGGFMGGHGGGGRPGGFGGGGMDNFGTVQDDTDSTSIKGLKASGEMALSGGSFTFDCADDAIHSNLRITLFGGSYTIATGDDGIHADETLVIKDGTIRITESYEGLEGLDIQLLGGDIQIKSTDDGINAAGGNDQSGFGGRGDMFGMRGPGGMGGMGGMGGSSNGSILISGGSVYMNASGDGIDANGSLTISGGHVTVCGPTQGDTAVLDYDNTASITGGSFIGTGSQMMAQTFSDSSQGVLALSMGGTMQAGTTITITDQAQNVLLEYTPALDYAIMIVSTPEMAKGASYTVTIGEISGTFEAS